VKIACPSDCPYLASARDHPPARIVRQQEDDVAAVVRFARDLNEFQSNLFFLTLTFLSRYSPAKPRYSDLTAGPYLASDTPSLIDEDVTEALAALGATYETASRGVLYEHRPQSLPAERLVAELKPLLTEAGQRGGSAFERDAAVVLRRLEAAARHLTAGAPGNRRAFLELLGRVVRGPTATDERPAVGDAAPSRLIMP